MKEANIIVYGSSQQRAKTTFLTKKKGSKDIQVVHNFISINKAIIKTVYLYYNIKEVLDILIKPRFNYFLLYNRTNEYQIIKIKLRDEYKVVIIILSSQWLYLYIGQGLKGALYIYSQLFNLAFGLLLRTNIIDAFLTLIEDYREYRFTLYIDDYIYIATRFKAIFNFLHTQYFLYIAQALILLALYKANFFYSHIELLGFTTTIEGLQVGLKHQDRVVIQLSPQCYKEVQAFIYLILFLYTFILRQVDYIIQLKKSYIDRVPIVLLSKKPSIRYK